MISKRAALFGEVPCVAGEAALLGGEVLDKQDNYGHNG
jgi:hypothetical protein